MPSARWSLVELQHLVDDPGVVAAAEQSLASDVRIAADGTHVEHPPTVAPPGSLPADFPR